MKKGSLKLIKGCNEIIYISFFKFEFFDEFFDVISFFFVYVNLRSKSMPHIRHQKRITGLKSKAEALRKEKSLIKELSLKIAHQEGHGFTWRMIINQWAASAANFSSLNGKAYNPSQLEIIFLCSLIGLLIG